MGEARGAAALARVQLADGDVADELYRDAIELFSRTRVVSHLARARLCYGEWLRRNNRRTDAATQLRRAFDEFAAMGANAFAQRTRCELEATGEKVRARREDPGAGLTPQEHQIAQLARTRRTNPEIGAELFLSARTVEWHRLREGHFSFRDRGPSGTRLYVVTVVIPHGVRA